jgi:hypothetical protein
MLLAGIHGFLLLLSLSLSSHAAGVPNRIVYQGRLLKNGTPVTQSTNVNVKLIDAAGKFLFGQIYTVTPGPTGDFTLVLDNITNVNWLTNAPKLQLSVGNETLSPSDDFGTSPYAFVAQTVEDAAITSPKIAPAAVTDSHIAGGIAASKILVATTSLGGVTLDKWVKGTGIDASVIVGTVTTASTHAPQHRAGAPDPVQLTASQTDGTAIISSVTLPGYDQTIQPVVNAAVPLTIRGAFGGPTNSQQPILRLYGNENNNTLRLQTNIDGSSYLSGPLAVGVSSTTALMEVGGAFKAASADVAGSLTAAAVITPDVTASTINASTLTSSQAFLGNVTVSTAISSPSAQFDNAHVASLSAGTLTNFPAFRVYHVNGDPVPSDSPILIKFNRIDYDTHGIYTPSLGQIKPTIPGIYHFSFTVFMEFNNPGRLVTYLFKNGVNLNMGESINTTAGHYVLSSSCDARANGVTDTFQIMVYQTGSPTRTVGYPNLDPTLVTWSGHRVQ